MNNNYRNINELIESPRRRKIKNKSFSLLLVLRKNG